MAIKNRIPTDELEALHGRRETVELLWSVLDPVQRADVRLRMGVPLDAAPGIARRARIRQCVEDLEARETLSDEERTTLKELQARIGALLQATPAVEPPHNRQETPDAEN